VFHIVNKLMINVYIILCLHVAVCVKFLNRFMESLDDSTKSAPVKIENAFRKFCKTAKGDDNRFVSLMFAVYISHMYDSLNWLTTIHAKLQTHFYEIELNLSNQ